MFQYSGLFPGGETGRLRLRSSSMLLSLCWRSCFCAINPSQAHPGKEAILENPFVRLLAQSEGDVTIVVPDTSLVSLCQGRITRRITAQLGGNYEVGLCDGSHPLLGLCHFRSFFQP